MKGNKITSLMAALLVPLLFGCSSSDEHTQKPSAVTKQPIQQVEQIHPETIIRFPSGTIACMNRDSLADFVEHAMKGEKTKANAMDAVKGGDCIAVPPNKKMRVISVDYPGQDAPVGLLEVVGEKNQSGIGAWVFSVGAEDASGSAPGY
jgi:hypothetical protein